MARAATRVGLTAWLAGCVAYHPAPISAQAGARAFAARRLDDPKLAALMAADGVAAPGVATPGVPPGVPPGATTGATPGAAGWGLAQLTLAGLYFHPDMAVARATVRVAAGEARAAGEIPNPTLGFEELSVNASRAAPSPFTVAPFLNFLIETAGKRQDRMARQAALLKAARDAVDMTAWQVRAQVRDAWLTLWAGQRILTLRQAQARLWQDLAAAMARRAALGAADAPAAMAAQLQALQARAAVAAATDDLAADRAGLARAIGVTEQALEGIRLDFTALDTPPALPDAARLAELRKAALTGRADMRAALARYAAAEAGLKLAVASQYPDITLTPGYIYDQGQNKYALYPSLELPLFNQHQGEIATALARRQLAAAEFLRTEDATIADIRAAFLAAHRARTALRAARGAARMANRLDAAVTRGFAAGGVDRPGRDQARLSALGAADALLRARRADLAGLGALEDAAQTPLLDGVTVTGAAPRDEVAAR